jgi:hypothetical protein
MTIRIALAAVALFPAIAAAQQSEVDALLAADRAYSAQAAKTDIIGGLVPMFATRVIMPVPGAAPKFAEGIAQVVDALKANPANNGAKVEWTPIRGGISGDGQHGFTFGYMTVHRPDGSDVPAKYLSYWIRENGAWKVAAYKRSGRPAGDVSMTLMEPSLPAKLVPPTDDAATVATFERSLAAAEQAFSDEASVSGLGPAFEKFGRADAMNIGGLPSFTLGNVEIAKAVGGPAPKAPSPLTWKSDYRVIVASSGDLGVSIGWIHQKGNPAAAGFPFFTIWRRDSMNAPWRYIAE